MTPAACRLAARLLSLAGLLLGLVASPALAGPVTVYYANTVSEFGAAGFPGVKVGDEILVSVVLDNGGSTRLSQQWTAADVVSAGVTIGSGYSGSFLAPYFWDDLLFATDATGQLTTARFYDNDLGNSDSLGRSVQFLVDSVVSADPLGGDSYFAYLRADLLPNTVNAWFFRDAGSVPEPGSAALLLTGLVGLALQRRRRRG